METVKMHCYTICTTNCYNVAYINCFPGEDREYYYSEAYTNQEPILFNSLH